VRRIDPVIAEIYISTHLLGTRKENRTRRGKARSLNRYKQHEPSPKDEFFLSDQPFPRKSQKGKG
jgi:hypothetical protein